MRSKKLAIIPVRIGSKRLEKKNLREIEGLSLIVRAIKKCILSKSFDEIWVNSDDNIFREIAENEGAEFYLRPPELGSDSATSEQFIAEFLFHHECDYLFQVHSIAPLMTVHDIKLFVEYMLQKEYDCLLSTEEIQIECAYKGQPINFTYEKKTNSQDLLPIQRISWSITGWRTKTYLNAIKNCQCATYAGKVGYFSISRLAAHVIKTEADLDYAKALLPFIKDC
ncbi:MAG: cytidyltransferase [Deltaproteobacteria bacterium]|nr:cytidyltransferase [Deltaproteobacteria bacterium]